MRNAGQIGTPLVAHALGAATTFLVLRQTTDLLSWLTWQVSSLFGKTAGMHFYSMGVSADSRLGELMTRVLIVILPLLVLGVIAEAIERARRRLGRRACLLPVLGASMAGAGVWSIAARDDAAILEAWVLGVSVAILVLLLIAAYWGPFAGALRLLRRHPVRGNLA